MNKKKASYRKKHFFSASKSRLFLSQLFVFYSLCSAGIFLFIFSGFWRSRCSARDIKRASGWFLIFLFSGAVSHWPGLPLALISQRSESDRPRPPLQPVSQITHSLSSLTHFFINSLDENFSPGDF